MNTRWAAPGWLSLLLRHSPLYRLTGWLAPGLCALLLAACGGGGESAPPPPAATPPTIISQPASRTVTAGQVATFAVGATGTGLSYQWQRDGTAIAGATAASHSTPATTLADHGAVFSVTVSNSGGSVTSQGATLSVTAALVAPSITSAPAAASVTIGQTATFSVSATGSDPLTYVWMRNDATIPGAANAPSYTTPATVAGDDGARFSVLVSNAAGSIVSSAATLSVTATAVTPTVTSGPAAVTVSAGQTASFAVTVSGTAPFSYQWQRNGTDIAGATGASFTTAPVSAGDDGAMYRVVVANSAGQATSAAARLTVSTLAAPSIRNHPVAPATAIIEGGIATFTVTTPGGEGYLRYQWFKDGIAIPGAEASLYQTPRLAASDSGSRYHVVVTNFGGSTTSNAAEITVMPRAAPTVLRQPQAAAVQAGESASFEVVAVGTAPLAYQWYRNDILIPGATAARYTTAPALTTDEGARYLVRVTNASGTAQSAEALLSVGSQPLSAPHIAAGSTSARTVALRADGTLVSWRVWQTGGFSGHESNPLIGAGTQAHPSGYAIQVRRSDGSPFGNVVQVSASDRHIVALRADGTVWAWGVRGTAPTLDCMIGDGACEPRYHPAQVTVADGGPLTGVVQVSTGEFFTLALKSDGTVWGWGYAGYGQLGNVATSSTLHAVQITDALAPGGFLVGVRQVAAGFGHAVAVKTDGTVWAWGLNREGQVGGSSYSARFNNPRPVPVAGGGVLAGAVAVAAGYEHSLALMADGRAYAWGLNGRGQLGDGTTLRRPEAVPVLSLSSAPLGGLVAVTAGWQGSSFLTSAGTVLTTGSAGQDSQRADKLLPELVRDSHHQVLGEVVQLAGNPNYGGSGTWVVRRDGTVWGWGAGVPSTHPPLLRELPSANAAVPVRVRLVGP